MVDAALRVLAQRHALQATLEESAVRDTVAAQVHLAELLDEVDAEPAEREVALLRLRSRLADAVDCGYRKATKRPA